MINKVRLDTMLTRLFDIWPLSSREELIRICKTDRRFTLESIDNYRKWIEKETPQFPIETEPTINSFQKYEKELEAMETILSYSNERR